MQILETLIKKEMHVFKAFIKLRCTFLRRARKAYSNFYDLYKITVHMFEVHTMGGNVHEGKIYYKLFAARRNYELDSCVPVSRPTMNCSGTKLPKSQALRAPFPKIAERLRLSAAP